MEQTLHAVIKNHFEPDKTKQEIKIGNFIADIVANDKIIEIQTRGFIKLRSKLEFYLDRYLVTIVYPIPRHKWLIWIDPITEEVTKKRKSPRTGRITDAIIELYSIKSFLAHQNLRFCLLFVDVEEYRFLDGWGDDKKRGSTRFNRVPVSIVEEIYLDNANDYAIFIPDSLPEQFTSKDYKISAKTDLTTSRTALNILNHLGTIKRVGKQGNSYVYERSVIAT